MLSLLFWWGTGVLFAGEDSPAPPDFWRASVVVAVGRADWIYYHVTNLPKSSVLYCPEYPTLPEGYAGWPRQRLARPEVVEQRGQLFLRDPLVARTREVERAERFAREETCWMKLWRGLCSGMRGLWFRPKSYEVKNYLFRPKADEQFLQSTLFRYLPPDQFWQVCRNEIILLPVEAGQVEQAQFIAQGKREHKLVLALERTAYASTPQTQDFWQPWSVFVRGRKESSAATGVKDLPPVVSTNRWEQSSIEPGQADEQRQRKWRILRQTDLETGSYVDCLIPAEGQMASLWPPGNRGSLFQVWILPWGKVQAELVACWSVLHTPETASPESPVVQLTSTGSEKLVQGQAYRLSWLAPQNVRGQWGLLSWAEDCSGSILDEPRFHLVEPEGSEQLVAANPAGSEVHALWWKPGEEWKLITQFRQAVQPLPRVEMAWPAHLPLPSNQIVELNGHAFPSESLARILVEQEGRKHLLKELVGKADWQYSFSPEDLHLYPGRARLWVEYPAPWTSVSDRMETWEIRRALDVDLQVKDQKCP